MERKGPGRVPLHFTRMGWHVEGRVIQRIAVCARPVHALSRMFHTALQREAGGENHGGDGAAATAQCQVIAYRLALSCALLAPEASRALSDLLFLPILKAVRLGGHNRTNNRCRKRAVLWYFVCKRDLVYTSNATPSSDQLSSQRQGISCAAKLQLGFAKPMRSWQADSLTNDNMEAVT